MDDGNEEEAPAVPRDPPPSMPRLDSSPGRALSGAASHKGGGGIVGSAAADPGPDDDGPIICPGNRRTMQERRKPRRKIFGRRRKEAFLEHLATTANVHASAEAAGVCATTVYNHRMKDAEFREKWWIALEQGVAKLTALRLQLELERAAGRPDGKSGGTLEVALDGPPDARQIRDFYALLQSMREHSRGLSGEAKSGRPGGSAEIGDICREMARRLKAFEVRERSFDTASRLGSMPAQDERGCENGEENEAAQGPLHRPSDGPPPRPGEDQAQGPLHRPSDGPPPRPGEE